MLRIVVNLNVSDTLYELARALAVVDDNGHRPEDYIAIALAPGCLPAAEKILANALMKRSQQNFQNPVDKLSTM